MSFSVNIDCLYNKNGKLSSRAITSVKNTDLREYILANTSFLSDTVTWSERIYCINNRITELQKCPYSGKSLLFKLQPTPGYCKVVGKENIHKIRKTNISKLKDSLKTAHATTRFNLLTNFKKDNYNLLSRDCCIEFIQQRIRETSVGKSGRYITSKHLKQCKDTLCSILHYNRDHIIQPINWAELFYLTIHNTIPKTCVDGMRLKFNTFTKGYYDYQNNNDRIEHHYTNVIKPCIESQSFQILSKHTQIKKTISLKCTKCNEVFDANLFNGRWKDIYCFGCYGRTNTSKSEKEIVDFLKSIGVFNIIENAKILGKREIDIYLPDYKIGIEYNGLLWHSYGLQYPNNMYLEDKNKHLSKTEECERQGIQLLHVFENEWVDKPEIVKSIIKSKIGKSRKIYGRKCTVSTVSYKDAYEFCDANHIQGKCISSYNYGLYFNDELVSVMTFGIRKLGKNKQNMMELLRFCNKIDTSVIGGASKLFKYAVSKLPKQPILSYADRRYSIGKLYHTLGFEFIAHTQPNYWYVQHSKVEHRLKYTKQKLIKQGFDSDQTEKQIMLNRNYRIIYDCGSSKFVSLYIH